MISTSAIILTGETSSYPNDKGTLLIGNKALIRCVFDAVNSIVDEVIIVTNTQERADKYAKLLPKTAKIAVNNQQTLNCLSEVITGLEVAQGKYTLLLPYDGPFFNEKLAQFLIDIVIGKTAAVPRTSENEIEPLCAAYQTERFLEIAKQSLAEGVEDLQGIVEKLRGVRYISMSVVKQIDPDLHSFFIVNTSGDFKRAAVMLQGKQKQCQTKSQR